MINKMVCLQLLEPYRYIESLNLLQEQNDDYKILNQLAKEDKEFSQLINPILQNINKKKMKKGKNEMPIFKPIIPSTKKSNNTQEPKKKHVKSIGYHLNGINHRKRQ